MCLDISYLHGNQKKMEISTEEELNGDEIIVNPDAISDVPIKCLCGGNLLEYPPVFDPKAE